MKEGAREGLIFDGVAGFLDRTAEASCGRTIGMLPVVYDRARALVLSSADLLETKYADRADSGRPATDGEVARSAARAVTTIKLIWLVKSAILCRRSALACSADFCREILKRPTEEVELERLLLAVGLLVCIRLPAALPTDCRSVSKETTEDLVDSFSLTSLLSTVRNAVK